VGLIQSLEGLNKTKTDLLWVRRNSSSRQFLDQKCNPSDFQTCQASLSCFLGVPWLIRLEWKYDWHWLERGWLMAGLQEGKKSSPKPWMFQNFQNSQLQGEEIWYHHALWFPSPICETPYGLILMTGKKGFWWDFCHSYNKSCDDTSKRSNLVRS
jgi:hypothetical protein